MRFVHFTPTLSELNHGEVPLLIAQGWMVNNFIGGLPMRCRLPLPKIRQKEGCKFS